MSKDQKTIVLLAIVLLIENVGVGKMMMKIQVQAPGYKYSFWDDMII